MAGILLNLKIITGFFLMFSLISSFAHERLCSLSTTQSSLEQVKLENEIAFELSKNLNLKAQKEPLVILVGGYQGSGKTTLIRRLTKIIDANVISTDAIRQALLNRGVKLSPEFSTSVKQIYTTLLKKSLDHGSNTIIDANAHSSRIKEVETLLREENFKQKIIKIYLHASRETLKKRLLDRESMPGYYQGSQTDLEASLSSTKIDDKDYNLIIKTDQLTEERVSEFASYFLSYYSRMNFIDMNNRFFSSIKELDSNFISFYKHAMDKITEKIQQKAGSDSSFQEMRPSKRLEVEHDAITTLDAEILEPQRRAFIQGVDRSPEHLPYAHNQFRLDNDRVVSGSEIELSNIDWLCPDMIAAQGPMPSTIPLFWSMVKDSDSRLIVMLTDLFENRGIEGNKVKCTRYWPEKVGESILLDDQRQVILMKEEKIFHVKDEELWHSTLKLAIDGDERIIDHYWLKGWKDGKALESLDLHHLLIDRIHQHVKSGTANRPIIHCSAGVGRTGTIIGSYLAKFLLCWSSKNEIPINMKTLPLDITLYLRYQRSHLIHTLDQYAGFNRFVDSLEPIKQKRTQTLFKISAIKKMCLGLTMMIMIVAMNKMRLFKISSFYSNK